VPPALELARSLPDGVTALVVLTFPDDAGGAVLDPAGRSALRAFDAAAPDGGARLDPLESLSALLRREKAKGEVGEASALPVGDRLVLAVGAGAGSPRDYRRAAAGAVRRLKAVGSAAVAVPRRANAPRLQAFAEGLLLGEYAFKITTRPRAEMLQAITLVSDRADDLGAALSAGAAVGSATRLARDLANTPSSTKSPAWLARQAQRLARDHGLDVAVRDERALRAEGFGGIVGVGMGSANPPRLIELNYRPARPLPGHVVLIGKGITFDSGGLSLKASANMVGMKTDMAAGGAVIATMSALADLGVRVTSSPSTAGRRRKCSTPTPRAGSCSPTPSRTPTRCFSQMSWSISRRSPAR
jgi:leucyl aminopeptidase